MFKPRRLPPEAFAGQHEPVFSTPESGPAHDYFAKGVDPFAELERLVEETRANLAGARMPHPDEAAYANDPFMRDLMASVDGSVAAALHEGVAMPTAPGQGQGQGQGQVSAAPVAPRWSYPAASSQPASADVHGGIPEWKNEAPRIADFAPHHLEPERGAAAPGLPDEARPEPAFAHVPYAEDTYLPDAHPQAAHSQNENVDWDDPFDAALLEAAYPETAPADQAYPAAVETDLPRHKSRSPLNAVMLLVGVLVAGGALASGYVFLTGGFIGAPKVVSGPLAGDLKETVRSDAPVNSNPNNQVFDTRQAAGTGNNVHIVPSGNNAALPQVASDPAAVSPDANGPRKVRTVVVRTDGTVIQASGGVPQTVQTNDGQTAIAGIAGQAPAPAQESAPPTPTPAPAPAPAADTAAAVAPSDMATALSVLPPARPVAARVASEAPKKVAAAEPARSAAAGSGPMAQLSSQPSEEEARRDFAKLQKKFPDLLGRRSLDIQHADVRGKTYYRVRVGPFADRGQVHEFCDRFRGAGGKDCIVAAN